MAQFDSPWQSLLAGIGQGAQGGVNAFYGARDKKRAREDAERERQAQRDFMDEQRRTASRERFAMADAGEREGSASQVMDVFNFLSQPDAQRGQANTDLSMLLTDNPQLTREGITPNAASGMTSDPIREAFMARMLPRQKKQFAPPRPPTPRATSSGYKEPPHRKVARQTLTDFAKTLGLTEDALRNKIRTDPATRARFKIQMQAAWRSGNLEPQTPQQIEDHAVGIIGPG